MAYKRSRREYEADLQAQQSPFVTYGTPLPPLDPDIRDDGSYVPVWKQEVTDEQGRKRLHGAFTGGFSAGYFNTVGSKEGWTPSTFTSSRSNKRKNGDAQRLEDFMDDEDMADAAEAQKLQTAQSFTGLGSTAEDGKRQGLLMDLLRPSGATIGVKLLQKMGWKEGQGVGPKIRRQARDEAGEGEGAKSPKEHLFAPDNSPMIAFVSKNDRHGLGFDAQPSLGDKIAASQQDDDQLEDSLVPSRDKEQPSTHATKRGGIGVGVLNDLGSDDEDPYEIGPRISYNRTVGGDKKKNKKKSVNISAANPLLSTKPVFKPKKLIQGQQNLRKCNDGRLPLEGFVLSQSMESSAFDLTSLAHAMPKVPDGWKSARNQSSGANTESGYQSTAEAAKQSKLDARSRAAILGEAPLPGKSVFDYMSSSARDRLASASGKTDLPLAKGEQPPTASDAKHAGFSTQDPAPTIPELRKEVAVAALGRGIGGWMPYADDEAKRSRYRAFLELKAGIRSQLTDPPPELDKSGWMQELHEFVRAAQVFKPMTGAMASRFTTSSAAVPSTTSASDSTPLLQTPTASKTPEDPAEAAARMGMFGPMTRSIHTFYPTRLLCKRFNVKAPAHVQPDSDNNTMATSTAPAQSSAQSATNQLLLEPSATPRPADAQEQRDETAKDADQPMPDSIEARLQQGVEVDAERNDALEGQRAGEAVFKAIFGSDDESD